MYRPYIAVTVEGLPNGLLSLTTEQAPRNAPTQVPHTDLSPGTAEQSQVGTMYRLGQVTYGV